jgi:putative endonuclease
MNTRRQRIGIWGERIAAEYLSAQGYLILARNVRTPHGEIDILARREQLLVFIEVKTRTTKGFGYPEEAVTARKQAHMLAAAEDYLQSHPEAVEAWQFDVIAVEGKSGSQPRITHFENVIS